MSKPIMSILSGTDKVRCESCGIILNTPHEMNSVAELQLFFTQNHKCKSSDSLMKSEQSGGS